MRILFLAQDIGSKEMGMGYRSYTFARLLKKNGHEVQLVTAARSHVRRKNPKRNSWQFQEQVEELDYRFLGCWEFGSSLALRALNMLYFSFKAWLLAPKFAREFQPDVVVASSPHPMVIYAARRLAKQSGARLVFEVRDIWPLSVTKSSGASPKHPFIRLLQHAEDYAYKKSDVVVSLLSNGFEHMKTRGLSEQKYTYIPNGFDPTDHESSQPLNPETLGQLKDFKNGFSTIAAYTGAHGIMNQLDHLVLAAKPLSDLGIVLLGTGPEKPKLQKLAKDQRVKNILFLAPVPKAQIPDFLSHIDIAYIGLKDSDLFEFGISPNKLIDYMAAAKPVVMAVKTKLDPVEQSGCGIKCIDSTPQSIVKGFQQMLEKPAEERKAMGQKGEAWVKQHLNYGTIISQFEQAIQSATTSE